jgi:DNA-binding ferritin-like protein
MDKNDKIYKLLCSYVAFLRCVGIVHQNAHWVCKGSSFYGDHLLFERIYQSAQENVDSAAERFVGLFGIECLDLTYQSKIMTSVFDRYNDIEDLLEKSGAIEKDFIVLSEKVYNILKSMGRMSLGLDDLIMSICGDRETALYLIKQASAS